MDGPAPPIRIQSDCAIPQGRTTREHGMGCALRLGGAAGHSRARETSKGGLKGACVALGQADYDRREEISLEVDAAQVDKNAVRSQAISDGLRRGIHAQSRARAFLPRPHVGVHARAGGKKMGR
jgi:hypothetical protein